MVSRGNFVLYDGIVPALEAGDYELVAKQTLTSPQTSGLNTETHNSRIRVTAPRYKLSPDQILSTFPPANSEGAYESRLPQIVLKRRTLPWDRKPHRPGDPAIDPSADENTPWLALVVIAEGEGELSVEKPIAECVTDGVAMTGPSDVVKGVYLAVPETTVRKVFPTVEDLRLLAHVREVNKDDTENAMGDDDGFMAVVLANRLPQYDRVACKPVRYIACLINLEGQLNVLPPPTPPTNTFVATEAVFNASIAVQRASADPDFQFMGSAATIEQGEAFAAPVDAALPATLVDPAKTAQKDAQHVNRVKTGRTDQWRNTTDNIANSALTANSVDAAFVVRDAMKEGFRFHFEPFIQEKTFRFPVLNHWSFTCNGAGSLDKILQELDVGLLGTLPGPDAVPPRPVCLPDVTGSPPPAAPLPRPDPEVSETGHTGLPHQTREGEQRRAWYRGPFAPHATRRNALNNVSNTVLAHVSDQLRATVPDGREDLSLAIAFEIGRLLALSRPSIVAGMMRWRREQFGAARSKGIAGKVLSDVGFAAAALGSTHTADFGRFVGRDFIISATKSLEKTFGDARPIADPGRVIPHLSKKPIEDLANGLGIDRDVLSRLREVPDVGRLDALTVPIAKSKQDKIYATELKRLDEGLDRTLQGILGGVLPDRGEIPERGRVLIDEKDALGALIDNAIRRSDKEMK